ncbi:MAG TPA: (d)CMP kinase [Candidatus Dormibacteraeota bacterium]|nr:(d)CMP kinase [Candidatus Dormibacteraeota bacterium]
MKPTIAIDGPAGAGKSTVSRRLAAALGLRYVDTGAMYRVVGVLADEAGVDLADAAALATLCDTLSLLFDEQPDGVHVLANGRDLTRAIRTAAAGQLASKVSTQPVVRERLVALQRRLGAGGGVVMEGRDIGTVVLPDATVKIFLVASTGERARRRWAELTARGESADLAQIEREIEERDVRDRTRAHSPLVPAADALLVDTTSESVEEVVARVRNLVAGQGNS